MRKRMAKGDGILPKTRRSRLRLRRHLQLDSDIIACCFKEMDSQALEQEAEAAEPAGGEEACLRKVKRGPMMCGTFFPGIDWVVQEAAGKSRRRRRKKPLGIEMRMLTEVMKTRHIAGLSAGKILKAYIGGKIWRILVQKLY